MKTADECSFYAGGSILPGYEADPGESGVNHSHLKLQEAARDLQSHLPLHLAIESQPCTLEVTTWAYRCRCTFQIIRDDGGRFQYAMRHKGNPISLGTVQFPIATHRIQTAMKGLMDEVLNTSRFPAILAGLTSVTFSSAWQDQPESDCIVTCYHEQALLDDEAWKHEAVAVCQHLRLRQLNARSKKCLRSAFPEEHSTIRDSVFLLPTDSWTVMPNEDATSETNEWIEIRYDKPETAFYHPNAKAMKDALQWMLQRVSIIAEERPCRLLELYCGCGAHTVALGKTGLLKEILAIELDPRLVEACHHNIQLNRLQESIHVVKGDAGSWAKHWYKRSSQNFDILLVDPPRAGLHEDVCQMAQKGRFEHFLYISCGHKALLRDLERLADTFQVVHCRQLDLFPRTDSIETLVHLKRIK